MNLFTARQFSLTAQQTEIAAKFLAGEKMPFALQNYPIEIRMFVAKMREQIEQPKNPFGKKDE